MFCCFRPPEARDVGAVVSNAEPAAHEQSKTAGAPPQLLQEPPPRERPQEPEQERSTSFSHPSIPAQLTQLLLGVPAAGTRSNDLWANLQKTADALVASLGVTASSFYLFTTSRRFCKLVPNSSSPLCGMLRKSGWELSHAAEVPSAGHVAATRSPTYFQAPSNGHQGSLSRTVPVDFQLLNSQAGCQAFLMLPLYQGHTVVGALLLAHTEPIRSLEEHKWLGAYLPLLSLYLTETAALKLVNFTEKMQTASSLSQLAWIVSSELDSWFDWCHPEDTEARLVLLAPDQSAAMVLSRSVGALRTFDPVNSIDVLVSGGMRSGSTVARRRSSTNTVAPGMYTGAAGAAASSTDEACWSGPGGVRRDPSFPSRTGGSMNSGAPGLGLTTGAKMPPEEGLLGTHMSLTNTLTRRCLAEGSKLLFVADVMAALKKYGEPWKDVFMDQARVTNPTWVVAAPIAHGGRHLGAILWLSSSRLNPNMLAQTAKATVPPLLHTVARQVVHLRLQVSNVAGAPVDDPSVFWTHLLSLPHLNMLSGATTTTGAAANGGAGNTGTATGHVGLDTGDMASSQGGSVLGAGVIREGGSTLSDGALTGMDPLAGRQLRYTVMVRSDSVSTSALVRAYQTAIAQHQRATAVAAAAELGSAYEEIQVIAKAGQGAFGSVYVALWKGLVVAVKVMRQQAEGRRAMRTAWELAVTKSVSHPNIVMVYACFTDVVVVKLSKRLIRFVPAATTLADPGQSGGGAGGGADSGAGASSNDAGARCQVIIMEYCNLGPLHHYVAERKYAHQLAQQQSDKDKDRAKAAGAAAGGPASHDGKRLGPQPPAWANGGAAGGGEGDAHGSHGHVGSGAHLSAAHRSQPAGAGVGAIAAHHSNSSNSNSSGQLQSPATAGGAQGGAGPHGWATGPLDFSTTLSTLLEVASALQYLHSLGFIHCDLKPENVLLKANPGDPRGFTIKVSDFGLSELLTSDGPLMGELGGTVTHIAPEIVTHKRVTKAADAYAFGVVMWEILTGSRIYSDLFTSGREKRVRDKLILAKVAHEGLRPVFPEGTPPEYALLARRCWAADPAVRPNFSEVVADLELIQRKYCRATTGSLPGLEGLVPPTVAAAAAAAAAAGAGGAALAVDGVATVEHGGGSVGAAGGRHGDGGRGSGVGSGGAGQHGVGGGLPSSAHEARLPPGAYPGYPAAQHQHMLQGQHSGKRAGLGLAGSTPPPSLPPLSQQGSGAAPAAFAPLAARTASSVAQALLPQGHAPVQAASPPAAATYASAPGQKQLKRTDPGYLAPEPYGQDGGAAPLQHTTSPPVLITAGLQPSGAPAAPAVCHTGGPYSAGATGTEDLAAVDSPLASGSSTPAGPSEGAGGPAPRVSRSPLPNARSPIGKTAGASALAPSPLRHMTQRSSQEGAAEVKQVQLREVLAAPAAPE